MLDPAAGEREGAVVTAPETLARAADSPLAPALFPAPLPGGTELRVLEERGPFSRVRLYNATDVWIASASFTRIRP